ncbi:MAG: endonuclease/exonuclease/phosphatase family protein [Sandaracinus sp.]
MERDERKERRQATQRRWLYGGLAAALSLVVLARVLPFQTPFPWLVAESLAFWTLMPAYLLAAVAWWRGHRRIAGWLAVIALAHLAWSLEGATRAEAHAAAPPFLRLVDANLLAPRPDPRLADALLAQDADVLAIQELSDEWAALLDERGARERYPYRVLEPHPLDEDYFGIGIYARVRLEGAAIEPLPGWHPVPIAHADVGIDGQLVRIYSVHTAPPSSARWAEMWTAHMDALEERFRDDIARGDTALVAAGDYNASPFSFAHRRLVALGLSEAHEAVGRGSTTTWPNGVFTLPPMRLDHAYVHGLRVVSVRELPAITSDHSPLVIELARE